jgi:hypothetical protein
LLAFFKGEAGTSDGSPCDKGVYCAGAPLAVFEPRSGRSEGRPLRNVPREEFPTSAYSRSVKSLKSTVSSMLPWQAELGEVLFCWVRRIES